MKVVVQLGDLIELVLCGLAIIAWIVIVMPLIISQWWNGRKTKKDKENETRN